jgi:hypothetical protein
MGEERCLSVGDCMIHMNQLSSRTRCTATPHHHQRSAGARSGRSAIWTQRSKGGLARSEPCLSLSLSTNPLNAPCRHARPKPTRRQLACEFARAKDWAASAKLAGDKAKQKEAGQLIGLLKSEWVVFGKSRLELVVEFMRPHQPLLAWNSLMSMTP